MKKVLLLSLFLLLALTGTIFYFVSSEIVEDKGIAVILPPPPPETSALGSGANIKPRNVLDILVDKKGNAIIRKEKVALEDIKSLVKDFISNPNNEKNLSTSPKHAIISLGNEKDAPYKNYLNVYNEIKSAYNELWEQEARKQFKKSYIDLSREEKKTIRSIIPLVISEAAPSNF